MTFNRNAKTLSWRAKGFASLLIYLLALGCGCSPAMEGADWLGYTESGTASYYAAKFQSKKTASGKLYDKMRKTAAHKKLPFGTRVKVTNTKNGESVVVRINDRGPFVKDRIIDLSGSAFSSIANLGAGVIEVNIEVIE